MLTFSSLDLLKQIYFLHHYKHSRVIIVTGATGTGKSTQVPKLLLYAHKINTFSFSGKVLSTQPRIAPTIQNANRISYEMGVRISDQNNNPTDNFYIQYKTKDKGHTNTSINIPYTFTEMTDGTLYKIIKKDIYLTEKIFFNNNTIYNNKN